MIHKIGSTALLAATLLLGGCDYVEKPLQGGVVQGDCPAPTFPQNTNTSRNVLLEEFTGHTCGPCPGGAKEARDLEASYEASGKHLIVVSIHAGALSVPTTTDTTVKFNTEFRTISGNYFADELYVPALPYTPVGLVNRVPYTGSIWVDKGDWAAATAAEFTKPLEANLQMIIDYDDAEQKGCVHVETEYLANLSSDYYLVVYLLQDSIIDWQKNGGMGAGDPTYPLNTDVSNYVHKHVFRGCVTPKLGVNVSTGSVASGTKFVNSIAFDLAALQSNEGISPKPAGYAPRWNRDQFFLVAYVYDADTKEILQVIEEHIE